MQTVRTTIRIRKEILGLSKILAMKRGTSLQRVINDTLAVGLHISDKQSQQKAMAKIDKFRDDLSNRKVNVQKLIDEAKKDLEVRAW